ncbi:hypothetical protein Pan97_28970 [Bremerella volcania]|uniref:Sulfotransferase family protein n=2 Tax=Bremerella volcania TaxID=2527984 RepID=A0A518C9F6_9BACT|nr:hypothetical protein Pan97_28970 [Bremerella volcania]
MPHQGKIFGIGLSRTGTKSLATALNLLGIKTMWYPQDQTTYRELMTAHYRLTVLEEYQALTDTPVVPFYPQFDQEYPGSKFVLTIRDKESWLRSCEKHWQNSTFPPQEVPFWRKYASFIDLCVYGCNAFNASRFSYVYDRHVEGVQSYFHNRPDDLLIMNICGGEGYDRLCEFLDYQLPENSEFPKVNDFNANLLH